MAKAPSRVVSKTPRALKTGLPFQVQLLKKYVHLTKKEKKKMICLRIQCRKSLPHLQYATHLQICSMKWSQQDTALYAAQDVIYPLAKAHIK